MTSRTLDCCDCSPTKRIEACCAPSSGHLAVRKSKSRSSRTKLRNDLDCAHDADDPARDDRGQANGRTAIERSRAFSQMRGVRRLVRHARSRRDARPRRTAAASGQRSDTMMRSYFVALAFIPNAMDAALQAQVLSHTAG